MDTEQKRQKIREEREEYDFFATQTEEIMKELASELLKIPSNISLVKYMDMTGMNNNASSKGLAVANIQKQYIAVIAKDLPTLFYVTGKPADRKDAIRAHNNVRHHLELNLGQTLTVDALDPTQPMPIQDFAPAIAQIIMYALSKGASIPDVSRFFQRLGQSPKLTKAFGLLVEEVHLKHPVLWNEIVLLPPYEVNE